MSLLSLTANIEGLIQQRPEDVRVAWYNSHSPIVTNRLKRTCIRGLVLQPRHLIVHTNNKILAVHDIPFRAPPLQYRYPQMPTSGLNKTLLFLV